MKERTITKLGLLCSLTGLVSLYVTAAQLRPTVTPIAKLNDDFVGTRVMVTGEVIGLREHRDGHLFLKLKDESGGVISVPVFARVYSKLSEPIELLDVVQVTGEVGKYRDELQIVPNKASDLRVVHTSTARLPAIGKDNLGDLVKIQAPIVEREIVGTGSLILTLREDGSQLPVFVPASVVRNGFPDVHVGYVVRVAGYLQLYNDELELRLTDPAHIRVLEAA